MSSTKQQMIKTHVKAGTSVKSDNVPMYTELVCGSCRAVITKRPRYNWELHDHCGAGGCDCYGGNWTLFNSGFYPGGCKEKISVQ